MKKAFTVYNPDPLTNEINEIHDMSRNNGYKESIVKGFRTWIIRRKK